MDAPTIDYQASFTSPIGVLAIRSYGDQLIGIDFIGENGPIIKPKTYIAKEAILQLQCYFADPKFHFDLPLKPNVSKFQAQVLEVLRVIPVGSTRSYQEVAEQLHTSPRPIGNACRHNPIPIIIPCHRVLAKNNLGGYCGTTTGTKLDIKRWLLQHEHNP